MIETSINAQRLLRLLLLVLIVFKSIGMVIIFCFIFFHTLYHSLFFPHIIFHLWLEVHKTTTASIILFPTWFSNGKKKSPFSYRVYFDRFQDIVAICQRLFDFLFISFQVRVCVCNFFVFTFFARAAAYLFSAKFRIKNFTH